MIGNRHRSNFHAELLALIRKHDPQAKVSQFNNVTIVTSELIPQHQSLILQPSFSVLAPT